jgi:hypothetical protein
MRSERLSRYAARYNVDTGCWEVFDTVAQAAVETFPCTQDEELRYYAEHRALAHATRLNQSTDAIKERTTENEK